MVRNNCLHLILFTEIIFASSLACNVPPSEWCSSRKIARHCQVEYQCENYLKSTQSPSAYTQEFTNDDNDIHYYKEDVVKIGFYYETLCPDCKQFMNKQLYPAYKAIPHLFLVDFVPYGNAKEYWDNERWQFRCQHGEEECFGNIINTCALNYYPYNITFQFIACIEQSYQPINLSTKSCAFKFGLAWEDLEACSDSLKGNYLQHEMAVKTEALQPKHQFVPWLTLNGEHTDSIQKEAEADLIKLICDNFKGKKPSACKKEDVRHCPNNS